MFCLREKFHMKLHRHELRAAENLLMGKNWKYYSHGYAACPNVKLISSLRTFFLTFPALLSTSMCISATGASRRFVNHRFNAHAIADDSKPASLMVVLRKKFEKNSSDKACRSVTGHVTQHDDSALHSLSVLAARNVFELVTIFQARQTVDARLIGTNRGSLMRSQIWGPQRDNNWLNLPILTLTKMRAKIYDFAAAFAIPLDGRFRSLGFTPRL